MTASEAISAAFRAALGEFTGSGPADELDGEYCQFLARLVAEGELLAALDEAAARDLASAIAHDARSVAWGQS